MKSIFFVKREWCALVFFAFSFALFGLSISQKSDVAHLLPVDRVKKNEKRTGSAKLLIRVLRQNKKLDIRLLSSTKGTLAIRMKASSGAPIMEALKKMNRQKASLSKFRLSEKVIAEGDGSGEVCLEGYALLRF